MEAKDLSDFGAPYADHSVVRDPSTQIAAGYFNLGFEVNSQASRVMPKAIIRFTGTTVAGAVTLSSSDVRTQWGNGLSYAPTVTKGGSTSDYTVTFPTTYTDGLGNVETVSIFCAQITSGGGVSAMQAAFTYPSANSISMTLYNHSGTQTAHNGSSICLVVW